ncbi:HD domain-containing protein [Pseudomonadota bacterium]
MQTVSFTEMGKGTKEEYEFLDGLEQQYISELPERLMAALRRLDLPSGYRISRLQHSLQSATRAHRAGESEEMVVAALLHDIGDDLAPCAHSELAAAVLRPYVSEKIYWIVKYHGLFQMYYYAHHLGGDRNARDRLKGHQWYDDAVRFCELYDQNCFDPDYDTLPLEFFEPMLRRVISSPSHQDPEFTARYGEEASG